MDATQPSDADAARVADDVEALAFERMFAGAPAPLRERLGLRVEHMAGATLFLAPGLPDPMFNRVIGLGLRDPADESQLGAIAAAYRSADITNWWLHWNPLAGPANFDQRLRAGGWTAPRRVSWAKMLRGPHAAPALPTRLDLRPVAGGQALDVTQVIAQAFGMPSFMAEWLAQLQASPEWRLYAVCDGEQVVGGGYVFVEGEVAWLGVAGIAPSHRRLGGQAALMARRIDDAAAAGAKYIVTETGEPTSAGEANPSLANMKRCGFVQVASRLNFMPPP
jgi:hypothetical protein